MATLLIIFFASLFGLVFMIGRKMIFQRNNQIITLEENLLFEEPYIDEIRQATIKKMKKYGYIAITGTLRFSIKSSKFLNEKSSNITKKVRDMLASTAEGESPKEVSNFLKLVSDYKNKINRLKSKIREEEGIEVK